MMSSCPESTTRRTSKTADTILRAGQPADTTDEESGGGHLSAPALAPKQLAEMRARWNTWNEKHQREEEKKRYAAADKRRKGREVIATIRKMHDPNATDRPIFQSELCASLAADYVKVPGNLPPDFRMIRQDASSVIFAIAKQEPEHADILRRDALLRDLYNNLSPVHREQLRQLMEALTNAATARECAAFKLGWFCRLRAETNAAATEHAAIRARQRCAQRHAHDALRLTDGSGASART